MIVCNKMKSYKSESHKTKYSLNENNQDLPGYTLLYLSCSESLYHYTSLWLKCYTESGNNNQETQLSPSLGKQLL